jgi:hypothetical protein
LGPDKPGLTGLGQNDVVRTLLESASLTRLRDITARTLASDVLLVEVLVTFYLPRMALFFVHDFRN